MMGERAAAVAAFLLLTSLPVGCHELRPNPVDAGVDPARAGSGGGAGGRGGAAGAGSGSVSSGRVVQRRGTRERTERWSVRKRRLGLRRRAGDRAARVVRAPSDAPSGGLPRIPTDPAVQSARPAAWGKWSSSAAVGGGWSAKETCASICSGGACTGMCTPGDKHCAANQTPEICSPEGQWMPGTACEFVCSGKGDCTGACKPGTKRCSPSNMLVPETCSESGQWTAATPCQNLCSSGSCAGSCMPGQKRCRGDIPETCSPMGTWEPGARCQFVCTGAGDCSGECKPGAGRCAGLQAQECAPDGRWANDGSACQFVCSNGNCTGNCSPGARRCSSGNAETCSAVGIWQVSQRCDFVCTGQGTCGGGVPAGGSGVPGSDGPFMRQRRPLEQRDDVPVSVPECRLHRRL